MNLDSKILSQYSNGQTRVPTHEIGSFFKDAIDHYKLLKKIAVKHNVYARVEKGVYGLSQDGKIANQLLKYLEKCGYRQSTVTLGVLKHDQRLINVTFIADNFSIKYVVDQHANYLLEVLHTFYVVD